MQVLAFRIGADQFLVPLDEVRAVVRLRGLRLLPGAAGALIGVLDVQSTPVAVLDARPDRPTSGGPGDALVLAAGWPERAVAIACDEVLGLLDAATESGSAISGLPAYVRALLRVEDVLTPLVDPVALAEFGALAAQT
jgi:chemotaxis signal transduction protein